MNRQAVCVCLGGSTLTANSPHDRRELLCRTESRLGLCVKGVFVGKDGKERSRKGYYVLPALPLEDV